MSIGVRKPKALSVIFGVLVGIPVLFWAVPLLLRLNIHSWPSLLGFTLLAPLDFVSQDLVTIGKIGYTIHPAGYLVGLLFYSVLAVILALCFGCFTIEKKVAG